ncbi:MAG: hypothetical protein ACTSRA_06875, partial [Promethearchaeota archaeon]
DTYIDNLNDAFELKYGTDPLDDDSDDDGYFDGIEVASGSDPLNPADYPGKPPETPQETSGGVNWVTVGIAIGSVTGGVSILIMMMINRKKKPHYKHRKPFSRGKQPFPPKK